MQPEEILTPEMAQSMITEEQQIKIVKAKCDVSIGIIEALLNQTFNGEFKVVVLFGTDINNPGAMITNLKDDGELNLMLRAALYRDTNDNGLRDFTARKPDDVD